MSLPAPRVWIERLVLEGLSFPSDRTEWLRSRLAAELRDLLSRRGLPEGFSGGGRERVQAKPIEAAVAGDPDGLPRVVAERVYEAIGEVK